MIKNLSDNTYIIMQNEFISENGRGTKFSTMA